MADGISEKPWSDYTEADYSLEQWHRACLIHQHQGAPTSKQQCKLPVRTPTGVLSRAGVHAAAAALAGARGGVNASADEKMKASAALVRLYGKLNEEPPPSLAHDELANVENFLSHYGRKGMKWGQHVFTSSTGTSATTLKSKSSRSVGEKLRSLVRKKSSTPDKTMSPVEQHALTDAQRASLISAKAKKSGINSLSNAEMQTLVNRMNLERQYAQLTAQPSKLERGREFVNRQLKTGKTINDAIAFANSPAGKLMFSVMSPTKGRHAVGARASNRDLTPRALRKTRV
jgi:hypothetical protein